MTPIQKIILAAAVLSALIVILRKAMSYEKASRAEVLDAEPLQQEPLRSDDLRIAQNAPL